MDAKQKGMKKIDVSDTSSLQTNTTRVTRLLRRLLSALRARDGRTPAYRDLEEWTGVPDATLKDWFTNKGRPTAEFLLQMMERVVGSLRQQLTNDACRIWPILDHPRLKCDLTVISQLKTCVCMHKALVVIQGGTDESRTILISALANTFLALTERPRRVNGIDIHDPDWFVPVPGVTYLHNLIQPASLEEAVSRLWPFLCMGRNNLVLLNGVFSRLPKFENGIRMLLAHQTVIVADTDPVKILRSGKKEKAPVYLVTVDEEPETRCIRVEIQTP